MDKRGNFPTAEELLCSLPEKEIDEVPRKISGVSIFQVQNSNGNGR